MPPSECSYYTDSLDFSRKKDVELSLNRFALINIDEFDQVSATQQGFLKHILQKAGGECAPALRHIGGGDAPLCFVHCHQ